MYERVCVAILQWLAIERMRPRREQEAERSRKELRRSYGARNEKRLIIYLHGRRGQEPGEVWDVD